MISRVSANIKQNGENDNTCVTIAKSKFRPELD